MKGKIIFSILVLSVLAVSGCISGISLEDIANMSGEVKEFLGQYPEADVATSFFKSEYVEGIIGQIREDCGKQMEITDYWKVNVHDPSANLTLTVFIEAESRQAVCVIKKGGLQRENWFCSGWSECVEGEQTRTCVDLNRRGTAENKPDETRICIVPPETGETPAPDIPAEGGEATKGTPQHCSSDADCRPSFCPMMIGGDTPKCDLNAGKCYCGGECGDGYCDYYERTYGACPEDCGTNPVKIMEYFVMSLCPYGNQAEETIKEVYEEMKDSVIFSPHYVIYQNYNYPENCIDHDCSMHGIQELHQDMREICVKEHFGMDYYFEFVTSLNGRCSSSDADICWKDVAQSIGLDTDVIEQCQDEEGPELIKNERKLCDMYGVVGSPTIFINGKKYEGARTAEAFKNALLTWEPFCISRCGDGICQGGYYPCPETPWNCPQDCNLSLEPEAGGTTSGAALDASISQPPPVSMTAEVVITQTNLTVEPVNLSVKLIPYQPPIMITPITIANST